MEIYGFQNKFVSLLEQSALFFACADQLGDPFEGSFSIMNKIMRPIVYAGRGISEENFLALGRAQRDSRRFTLISCWHERFHESAAMWRLYSRETEGIAIKTDFNSFKRSLIDTQDIYVGRINYVDYENHFIPENNSFSPFLHKRQSFEHEREVRAICYSKDLCDIGNYYRVDLISLPSLESKT